MKNKPYLCIAFDKEVWKFGWVAETTSLLNWRTGNRTGGSNPPASAEKGSANLISQSLFCVLSHLSVRCRFITTETNVYYLYHKSSSFLCSRCIIHMIHLQHKLFSSENPFWVTGTPPVAAWNQQPADRKCEKCGNRYSHSYRDGPCVGYAIAETYHKIVHHVNA